MTILENLYEKYGTEKMDKFLYSINHGDKNFKLLSQYLLLSENYKLDNFSYYKSNLIAKLNSEIADKMFLYEITNIISEFDFTFKPYNTIITYGTFDLFHIGHLNLLKRIKDLCSNLIVGVSTDEFNALKGKKTVISYYDRSKIVSAIKYVDKVIPEHSWEQKLFDVEKYNVDCFVIGDDWKGQFDFLKEKCDVLYLPRTPDISSTKLKTILSK